MPSPIEKYILRLRRNLSSFLEFEEVDEICKEAKNHLLEMATDGDNDGQLTDDSEKASVSSFGSPRRLSQRILKAKEGKKRSIVLFFAIIALTTLMECSFIQNFHQFLDIFPRYLLSIQFGVLASNFMFLVGFVLILVSMCCLRNKSIAVILGTLPLVFLVNNVLAKRLIGSEIIRGPITSETKPQFQFRLGTDQTVSFAQRWLLDWCSKNGVDIDLGKNTNIFKPQYDFSPKPPVSNLEPGPPTAEQLKHFIFSEVHHQSAKERNHFKKFLFPTGPNMPTLLARERWKKRMPALVHIIEQQWLWKLYKGQYIDKANSADLLKIAMVISVPAFFTSLILHFIGYLAGVAMRRRIFLYRLQRSKT